MTYASTRFAQRGFTLTELSIVLIIIGLIIGGVLTGQQIIQNARVTNALNAIQSYTAQFQTYVQNYGALPGDDISAVSRFTNTTPTVSSHGGGDGVIGTTTGGSFETETDATGECHLAWLDLRAAGLVKNQVDDFKGAGYPSNPFGGIYAFQTGAFGSLTSHVLCLNEVPASAAQTIDSRLDDGDPSSGAVQASATTSTAKADSSYTTGKTYTVCVKM